jgi:outer membrane receptor protein involved in Fe transport
MKFSVSAALLSAFTLTAGARAQTPPAPAHNPAETTVQDVVVTAQRPRAQTLIDRKVYTVGADLQSTAGTAADVLSNVPSVQVDADGGVSLRGDSNVTILVDGKPSAQFTGAASGLSLQQFPASDVDRIEVLTSPPAQFKAAGSGGVINIITKKTRKAGFSGALRANGGADGRYGLGLDGAYNVGKWKLSGGVGLRQDIRERVTADHRTALDPTSGDLVQSAQTIDEHFRRLIPSVKADVDYALNDRQSVGASYSHRELTGARYFDQHDVSGPPDMAPTSLSDRHSNGHEWSVSASEGLRFSQALWRPHETLDLSLQRSVTRERERYAYRNTSTLPAGDPTFDDLHLSLDLVKTEFSADYDLPMPDERELKLGYDIEDDRNAFDNRGDIIDPLSGLPVVDPSVTNHFRYTQQVNAAYGDYQTPLGRWKLDAGLRLEAAHVAFLQITGHIPGGRNDFGAYPSLHLERGLGDEGKLTLAFSRRVTRPDPEALNPFADHQDTHNLRAGNPNLLPQDTWTYEAGYLFSGKSRSYGATAYARFDRDSVTDIVQPVGPDVVLATKTNLPRSRSAGLEFSTSGKLGRQVTYSLSGDAFYSQIDASALGGAGLKTTTGVNLKASVDYRPTKADTLQISFTRADKRLTPQGYVSAIDLVNLGYKHQVRPDLSLVATVTDLFDGQRQQRLVSTPGLHDVYLRHQYGRVAYVGVVYTFGVQPKSKASGFDYE